MSTLDAALTVKKRIRLRMSYDGTDFYGWQKQKNQQPSIQGILENCLSKIYDSEVAVVGSGRTDRGVHALNQWAHADLPAMKSTENLAYKLQRMTPEAITIKTVESCPSDFHAQISAQSKRYIYRFFSRKRANPFLRRYSWHYQKPMDLKFLQESSKLLMGTHDFSSFQSTGTVVATTTREIQKVTWVVKPSGFIDFHITGTGFLKQMVRNIVGTLIWLHEREGRPEQFLEILNAQDRQRAGPPAPPQGLYLATVKYPVSLDNKCRKL